jgi:ATP-dependent DNA helicase RecG
MMLGVSVARNRKLADVFYRLKLIEAFGTGMPKIMKSYEGVMVKPVIEVTDNAFKISLPNKNTISERAVLNENEQAVIDLLYEKDFIVRKDVEAVLDVSQSMAVRILKSLVDKGKIRVVGGGKRTRYFSK